MKKTTTTLLAGLLILGAWDAGAADKKSKKKEKAFKGKVINIKAFNDKAGLMKYDPNEFKVKTGEKVRLILKNTNGPIFPKVAMGHNLVILKKGVTAIAFGVEVTPKANLTNDMMPKEAMPKVFKHTKLLGPGESDTIEFTAPEPGAYEFVCTFTGHFALMRGKMTVTK
ncbi:MAG: plastocyanin/azurin family copper-binding protein [Verrucomicrobiota bacterium]|nr:plastocyanin/azurin family copper-binding protein [Verrucomicrobiota bacterium]